MKINHKALKQLPGIIEIWNAYHDTDKKIYEMDYFNEFLDGALPLEIAQMLAPGFDAYREYFWYNDDRTKVTLSTEDTKEERLLFEVFLNL